MPDGSGPPRVSILIPAYNTAEYIGQTLASVFAQTFTDFEAIVVNDGSPDTPLLEEALKPYANRITYILQENRGVAAARNTALENASGEYIALLDSDDYWHPEYLEVLVGEMERRPELDVVFPDAVIVGDAAEAGLTMMQDTPLEGNITFDRLLAMDCWVFVSSLARRRTVMEAGMFDPMFRSSEDYELWLRVLQGGGRIGYSERVLAYYRRRAGSLTANLEGMFDHHEMVWNKVEQTMKLTTRQVKILKARREHTDAKRNLTRGRAAFAAGDYAEARARLRAANATMRSTKLAFVLLALSTAPDVLLRAFRLRERFVQPTNSPYSPTNGS